MSTPNLDFNLLADFEVGHGSLEIDLPKSGLGLALTSSDQEGLGLEGGQEEEKEELFAGGVFDTPSGKMAGKASQDQMNEFQHYFTYKMQMCVFSGESI